jgi:hypothetical protein
MINDAHGVTSADIEASNDVIHMLNRVIVPLIGLAADRRPARSNSPAGRAGLSAKAPFTHET